MTDPAGPATGGDSADLDEAAAAYMAMLRRIHDMSGLTAGQVAVSSGLPRSTTYRFVDPKNTVLPKNRDQVQAFLRGCRTPQSSVDRMLELWDDLNSGSPHSKVPLAPDGLSFSIVADDDPLAPRTKTAYARRREWDEEQYSRTNIRPARRRSTPASAAQSQPPREDELAVGIAQPFRTHPFENPHSYTDSGHQFPGTTNEPPKPASTPWWESVLAFCVPLGLFFCTLYPLGTALWLGGRGSNELIGLVSAVLVVMFLSMAFNSQGQGPDLTLNRLLGAALTGISSALLAWATVPALPTAALTGFGVFVMAPIWSAVIDWTGITTTRGAFASLAAIWFGFTMSAAALYIGLHIAGSILVGTLGAATALAILCGYTQATEETAWTKLRARAPYASKEPHPTDRTPDSLKRLGMSYLSE
ncbi:hypothetical protein AB0H60_35600 [Nocardia rhamnosiphila]|uniref:hypothetical protein n=1 Tax=Nocardia rhamnosiphila TaxID=426716 RepID=UPI0033F5D7C9